MRKLAFSCLLLGCLYAGDWLSYRGDAQATGWQKRGKSINAGNAADLKLLWKLALDNQSKGLNSLTAPTMLGPIVTHRGIKELVFVGGASDNIYAVDVDRGRLFWKRHVAVEAAGEEQWPCGAGLTAAPAFAPAPPGKQVRDEDEDEDGGHTPMRPFYFVASDGALHAIRPSDGVDMAPVRSFVPAHANLSALNFANGLVYATTANGCGGAPDGLWSIQTADPTTKAAFSASKLTKALGVSVSSSGTVYSAIHDVTPIPFLWKGRELLIAAGAQGVPIEITGLATWVDDSGSRWVYAASDGKIMAFRAVENALVPDWVSLHLTPLLAPVIAHGVVFALASGEHVASRHATLYALDAHTGKTLYSSGDAITSFVHSSALAVANGHICFGTSDNTLYCFGFPIEM